MNKLNKLVEPLEQLNDVIGITKLKNIINHIIYFLQDLDEEKNMMHTVINNIGVGKLLCLDI